ncbi:MAG: hypothetical protein LBC63_08760 [Holophagales bacterium]|jgi:inner membrane protein involved in colicin E2 resistance|nr:hypothetical protein [Holophagales bacterium]
METPHTNRATKFEIFLISLSFSATICFAIARKLDVLELSWIQVFVPVIGYFSILVLSHLVLAVLRYISWRMALRRAKKISEAIEAIKAMEERK